MRRPLWLLCAALTVALLTSAAPPSALRRGDSGDRVAALQARLIELGFLHGLADGEYGLKTQQAVSRFQRQFALRHDGVAGSETLDLLGADAATVQAIVHIAPSGRRYHARENCRGLRNAQSVSATGFFEAQETRTPCILCYGRTALHLALEARAAPDKKTTVGSTDAPPLEPAA